MKKGRISFVFIIAFLPIIQSAVAGPTVYIPLGSGNQVIAVDAATDTITASFSGVINSHGLVATPDGEYLIAGSLKEEPLENDQPKDSANSQLYLIHPAHGHVMSTIPVAGWTHHQAITPDGRYVISTHGMRGNISVVDVEENRVVRTIDTGKVPNYTLITADGKKAYVSNTGDNSIVEIDLVNWEVNRKFEAGAAPEHMAFSRDEKIIYVTNPPKGKVSAISVESGKILKEYDTGKATHGLDMGDDGKTFFASSKKGNTLVAVNTETDEQRKLSLSPAPYHLNTIKGTGKVYVSSRKKPVIWVVDQKSLELIGEIKLPAGEGHQMAIVE